MLNVNSNILVNYPLILEFKALLSLTCQHQKNKYHYRSGQDQKSALKAEAPSLSAK